MSNGIAPLPSGAGVTVVAEHRPRREAPQHHAPEDDTPAEEQADGEAPPSSGETPWHRPTATAASPLRDEPGVPAETLFEATLLANRLLPHTPSTDEYLLRQQQEWSPPESGLRLKDRLI